MSIAAKSAVNGPRDSHSEDVPMINKVFQLAEKILSNDDGSQDLEVGMEKLKDLISTVSPSDVGVSATHKPKGRQPVTYSHIYEDSRFSLGIFFIDKGYQIPLHDHPGMHVISHMLYGKAVCRSWDWVMPSAGQTRSGGQQQDNLRGQILEGYEPTLRKVCANPDMRLDSARGDRTGMLDPVRRNLHAIYAVTDCAFFDLLSPPYASGERGCHYYQVYEVEDIAPGQEPEYDPDGRVIHYVVETGPFDYVCYPVPYTGPTID